MLQVNLLCHFFSLFKLVAFHRCVSDAHYFSIVEMRCKVMRVINIGGVEESRL
ncbi:hypothetical protein ACP275_01G114800 [Erythranthe tilingii]